MDQTPSDSSTFSVSSDLLAELYQRAQAANSTQAGADGESPRTIPSAKNLPLISFNKPLDLALAVESLILTNYEEGNVCSTGQCLVASLVLLSRGVAELFQNVQAKSQELGTLSTSETLAILSVLDCLKNLQAIESRLRAEVGPTVSNHVELERESRGEPAKGTPLRSDYISTAVLDGLGIDREAFDDYFKTDWCSSIL